MLTFDHLKLVRRNLRELKKFRRWLLEATAGTVEEVATVHEDDGSCCRMEPWHLTVVRIQEATKAPVPTVMVDIDHR